jgi:hypothetical protein
MFDSLQTFSRMVCGQFPFFTFPQDVGAIYPASIVAWTLTQAKIPTLPGLFPQTERPSAQVIHKVLHRTAAQSISPALARRLRIGTPTKCPSW